MEHRGAPRVAGLDAVVPLAVPAPSPYHGWRDEICRPDVIVHDPIAGEQRGIEAYRGLFAFFRQAFGEQRTDLHQFVAEGDFVALLHTHNAKNTGSFMGAPPTHTWITVPGVELFRLEGGKIAEFWRFDADAALLAQLGLLPAPQAA